MALRQLRNDKSIVTLRADEGNTTVIMDRSIYNKEMNSTKVQTLGAVQAMMRMRIYIKTPPLGYNESMWKITMDIQAQPQRRLEKLAVLH